MRLFILVSFDIGCDLLTRLSLYLWEMMKTFILIYSVGGFNFFMKSLPRLFLYSNWSRRRRK